MTKRESIRIVFILFYAAIILFCTFVSVAVITSQEATLIVKIVFALLPFVGIGIAIYFLFYRGCEYNRTPKQ